MIRRRDWIVVAATLAGCAATARAAGDGDCVLTWTEILRPPETYSAVVGDIDRDGDPDIIAEIASGSRLYLNNGNGTFVEASSLDFVVGHLTDLNDDGWLDVLSAYQFRINNGDGSFAEPVEYICGKQFSDAVPGDMNGDGLVDIVTAVGSFVRVSLNEGNASFQEVAGFSCLGEADHWYDSTLTLGDLDSDGDLDVIHLESGRPHWDDSSVEIGFNDGTGSCVGSLSIATGVCGLHSAAIGDLDGDLDADIVVAGSDYSGACEEHDGDLFVLWNQGDASFSAAMPLGVGFGPRAVAITDLDGDSDEDIVLFNGGFSGSPGPRDISMLLNRGDGTYAPEIQHVTGSLPGRSATITLVDLNGDVAPDMVACSSGEFVAYGSTCASCPGDVDGSLAVDFQDLLLVLSSWGPCESCDADIDRDGEVAFGDVLYILSSWGPCPQPGACCLADGSCNVRFESECAVLGLFQGEGTECDPSSCPLGACCFPDFSCQILLESLCEDAGGSFAGDETNCSVFCDRGACCLDDGSCFVVPPATCDALDGTYQGDGTVCEVVSCP